MTEAALALSEQKNHNMGELLTQVKVEKEEQWERQSRERKKEQEVRPGERTENNVKTSSFTFVGGNDYDDYDDEVYMASSSFFYSSTFLSTKEKTGLSTQKMNPSSMVFYHSRLVK